MIEKLKAVNNPLTIIAIFAGLAEIAGTAALAAVDKSLQGTFVWFVMGFPVLLVVAFFATLNFNPKVLYAPSDFKDEENFLYAVIGTRSVSTSLDQVMQQLEVAKKRILDQAEEHIATVSGQERKKLTETVNNQLNGLETRLELVRREAAVVASATSGAAYPHSGLQAQILRFLAAEPAGCSTGRVAKELNRSELAISRALERLEDRGLITVHDLDKGVIYRISKLGIGSTETNS